DEYAIYILYDSIYTYLILFSFSGVLSFKYPDGFNKHFCPHLNFKTKPAIRALAEAFWPTLGAGSLA
ncbi:MAG: hypothetical protein FWH40_08680, partial [Coriobacteriia bacterium]|nr:hypothetical protein [Coriobacteriia bacterium]